MPPTNDFLPFCPTTTGTNLLTQGQYAVDADLSIGNQPGVARSKLVNKALRQATYIASCLAQFLSNQTGQDVLDDATSSEILATMTQAFSSSSVLSKAVSYALAISDDVVLFTAVATATLPTAVGVKGKRYTIKRIGAVGFLVTIATTSAQTIEGLASSAIKLGAPNDLIIVESDGSNWFFICNGWSISAQLALTSNYTTGVNAPIKFDTVISDILGNYSTSTGLFTVPESGLYHLSFTGLLASGGGDGPTLTKNGAGITVLASVTTGVYGSGGHSVRCAVGDTLGVYSGGGNYIGSGTAPYNTYLSIERIGN